MSNAANLACAPSRCKVLLTLRISIAYSALGTVRHGSFSAIHRGLRRSERAQFGEARNSAYKGHAGNPRSSIFDRTTKALAGATSPRQKQKLLKKLGHEASEAEADEDAGRQTRRKRFLDPGASFGKRSLVFQLKHGSLKDTAASLELQEPFLYGKSVVKAALNQGRRQIYKLYVYGGENRRDTKDDDAVIHLAKSRGVPVTIVPTEDQRLMDKMSMGRPHNGLVLETSPLCQLPVKSLGNLEESTSRLGFHVVLDHQTKEEKAVNGESTFFPKSNNSATSKPFVLLLHEILDPGNLGAMLRTASYMGVDAVGITNRNSSTLSPVVLKSAAGAAEEVAIFTVDSPVQFLEDSRAAGWKAYAAVAPPEKKLIKIHGEKFISAYDIEQARPLDQHPCVLVLGNEGYGLPRQVKMASDFELSVPKFSQGNSVDSLNVSVAAGLLCHTFVRSAAMPEKHDAFSHQVRSIMGRTSPATGGGETLF
ncbi:hypothetical protein UVI_02026570 [Ustilaginoidea virens]|uniref:rRNA methyltransferase 1, mitochondrial n=1 Tax=Ustilaginoidea virens TaxID=1159556 RepID=A0A1B5L3P9_USTVR|nr:hypothetical protein UVI_02026570 [Ustilaginoidea virens]